MPRLDIYKKSTNIGGMKLSTPLPHELPRRDFVQAADHMNRSFGNRMANIEFAIERLKNENFDTIVCTGISGIMFASPLALLMNKHIIVVRKGMDNTHSSSKIESSFMVDDNGNWTPKSFRWIFVDDLIDSGKTFNRVKKMVNQHIPGGEYVGDYLYQGHNWMLLETGR